ncbi:sulfite exporter TauE/SafE family protein [Cecembia rubra]|uniref:sulfite exporter TauE/SafE family protein n=1 Tax=Cecembia rubra TaxID=1485585 RepID=UPI002715548E|nr:sulfite exporter TauE/SafE family protein [Cecembia rubra]
MEFNDLILYLLLPTIAFLYASVGHGGASSYLMILALMGFAPEQIRPTALIMNMFVSMLAFLSFRKASVFPLRLFLLLVAFSVPAAYLGGTILVDTLWYKRILGILLIFPILKFFQVLPKAKSVVIQKQWWLVGLLGLIIGLVSGLIGIGGGIILSPILLLLGWADIKETAAISALFIFVNSVSGFLGAGGFSISIDPQLWIVMPMTIIGGGLGGYWGASKFQAPMVKKLLALVLLVAAVKLILD